MIARIWHGATPAARAAEYGEYLQATGVKDYRSIPGNRGVLVLRRIEGDLAHFLLLSLWESEEALRAFAGPAPDRAVYYPRDREFLVELEPTVVHWELVGGGSPGPPWVGGLGGATGGREPGGLRSTPGSRRREPRSRRALRGRRPPPPR